MALKRKIALGLNILLVFAVLVVGLLAGLYFYLPHYLEARILPQLASETGISPFEVNFRHIGLFGADLGDLRIGSKQHPALRIHSVQIDYSPQTLYHKKIAGITLTGIELFTEFRDGKVSLRGIDVNEVLSRLRTKQSSDPGNGLPPLFPQRLTIADSVVTVQVQDRSFRIPFEVLITPETEDGNRLNAAATLYPREQRLHTDAQIDLKRRHLTLQAAADLLDIHRFSDLIPEVLDLKLFGKLDLKATAQLKWAPLEIAAADGELVLNRFNLQSNGFRVENARGPDEKELPFRIELSQTAVDKWKFNSSTIAIHSPVPLTLSGCRGWVASDGKQVESAGDFIGTLLPSAAGISGFGSVQVSEFPSMQGSFTAQYGPARNLQFTLRSSPFENAGNQTVRLTVDGYRVSAGTPSIDITGAGNRGNLTMTYSAGVSKLTVASQAATVHLPRVDVKGTAASASSAEHLPPTEFHVALPNAAVQMGSAEIKISQFDITGRTLTQPDGEPGLQGMVQMQGADVTMPDTGIRINGIRGEIPVAWPPANRKETGSIAIASLFHKKLNLGAVRGKISQTIGGFNFEGRHTNRLLPELSLDFSGTAHLFGTRHPMANLEFTLGYPEHGPEIDLGKFRPEYRGVEVDGKLALSGNLALDGRGITGSTKVQVDNGSLRISQSNFAVEGIQLTLSMPQLPDMRSAAGQNLVFSKISVGDQVAHDGKIDFQIESPRSILIEKIHFIWCDGNIDTLAMRFTPGMQDYLITFYCDRLNMAMVLEQFGAGAAEGEGRVNGRIPLRYTHGKIRFDDGFLYSTPGKGGKIHFKGTEILTAGVPPGSSRYVQMELAREALKDYDWSWAKLNITSEGEELLLQMQMDGKPAEMLPFVYSKDIGGFVKVEAKSKGSKFQGIRLDVNFRLPLDKMLQYKELIKMIQ